MKKIFFISISLLMILMAGLTLYGFIHFKKNTLSESDLKIATLLKHSRELPAFALLDMHKKSFTNASLKNDWHLLFLGFTSCPSICPTTLGTLNQVYQKLAALGVKKLPKFIFVSLDPEQDTPDVLSQYLSHFNASFSGITGNKEDIDRLANSLGAVYMKVKDEKGAGTIDHSASIFVVNPEGHYYALFTSPNNAEDIAIDLKKIMRK